MAEFMTNPAVFDRIALRGQAVAQKEFSLKVMIPQWEATAARLSVSRGDVRGEA
jgi:hypothetical protein